MFWLALVYSKSNMAKQQVAYNRYLSNLNEWKHCTEMFVCQSQYTREQGGARGGDRPPNRKKNIL